MNVTIRVTQPSPMRIYDKGLEFIRVDTWYLQTWNLNANVNVTMNANAEKGTFDVG